MRVGVAVRTINCALGSDLCGQLFRRQATGVRDDLEANLALLKSGDCAVLLVSLDLLGYFEARYIASLRRDLAQAAGIPEDQVLIFSTHTHCGPVTFDLLPDAPVDRGYLTMLRATLLDGVQECQVGFAECRLYWGQGEVQVGYNRRLRFEDGHARTYGNVRDPRFVGLEGPDDPTHTVLWGENTDGNVRFLLLNDAGHATCIENSIEVSADFPGEARRLLRQEIGSRVPVLYLAGASADLSPWNLFDSPPIGDGERRMAEIGRSLAMETLRILRHPLRHSAEPISHALRVIHVPFRRPSWRSVARAVRMRMRGTAGLQRSDLVMRVHSPLRLTRQWLATLGREKMRIHALRLGGLCILTSPVELYCEFGRRLRQESGSEGVMIGTLCDGASGYCPTPKAIAGGGYSAEVGYWCRLAQDAGERILSASLDALRQPGPKVGTGR